MSAVAITLEYQLGGESGEQTLERLAVGFERAGAGPPTSASTSSPSWCRCWEDAVAQQFDAEGTGPVRRRVAATDGGVRGVEGPLPRAADSRRDGCAS